MKRRGIRTVIYTDITRDGMLTGPNIEALRMMVDQTGMEIIASGGMSVPADVEEVKNAGAQGVIIGKALYTGGIGLAHAIEIGEKTC